MINTPSTNVTGEVVTYEEFLLRTIQELKEARPTRIKLLINGRARWIRETDIVDVRIEETSKDTFLRVNMSGGPSHWFTLPLHDPQALALMDWLDADSQDLTTK